MHSYVVIFWQSETFQKINEPRHMFPSKIQGKYQQAIHLWLKETHPENNISSSQQSVKYVLYAKKL